MLRIYENNHCKTIRLPGEELSNIHIKLLYHILTVRAFLFVGNKKLINLGCC